MGFDGVQMLKKTVKYELSTTLRVFKKFFKLSFKGAQTKWGERKVLYLYIR